MSYNDRPLVIMNTQERQSSTADNYFTYYCEIEDGQILLRPNGHDRGSVPLKNGRIPETTDTKMGKVTFDGVRFRCNCYGCRNDVSAHERQRKILPSLIPGFERGIEDSKGISYMRTI